MYQSQNHIALVGVLILIFSLSGCTTAHRTEPQVVATQGHSACAEDRTSVQADEKNLKPAAADRLRDEWGIEVLGITSSAVGYMIDFRYRVIDPDRALLLMDRAVKPFLIDQSTGARLFVPSPPKVGSLRQRSDQPRAGRTYAVLFANPGRMIHTGDSVTVAIGECRLENLIVQ